MQRGYLDDLRALVSVAQERSFTRAAVKLGVSQSALSQTIRDLESRLGVRLLTRTTRSVSPTAAGERVLHNVAPRLGEIEAELAAIRELREKPTGTIRITATEYAADAILLPKLAKLLRLYPDIKVEIAIDYGLTDIVAERYDAGVRSGEQVAKDMIAVLALLRHAEVRERRPLSIRKQSWVPVARSQAADFLFLMSGRPVRYPLRPEDG
jgi:DNA-binding transcriptional LysR family regulator